MAGLLDVTLSKGDNVIEGKSYDTFPALMACWNAAPYDTVQKDEPIAKSWTQQSVAERAEGIVGRGAAIHKTQEKR